MEPLPSFQEQEQSHHPSCTGDRSHLGASQPTGTSQWQWGPGVLSHRSGVGTEKGQIWSGAGVGELQSGHVGPVWSELAEVRLEVRLTLVPLARLSLAGQGQLKNPKASQQETVGD